MRARRAPARREPTIALINVVFLMLVFFMVAGTLAPPLDPALSLVRTADLEGAAPPDALIVHPDGRLIHRGRAVATAAGHVAGIPEADRAIVRVIPDRALPAARLVALARELREAGAGRVILVTERGLR